MLAGISTGGVEAHCAKRLVGEPMARSPCRWQQRMRRRARVGPTSAHTWRTLAPAVRRGYCGYGPRRAVDDEGDGIETASGCCSGHGARRVARAAFSKRERAGSSVSQHRATRPTGNHLIRPDGAHARQTRTRSDAAQSRARCVPASLLRRSRLPAAGTGSGDCAPASDVSSSTPQQQPHCLTPSSATPRRPPPACSRPRRQPRPPLGRPRAIPPPRPPPYAPAAQISVPATTNSITFPNWS
ncbi:uncharacterized protein CC84DRAFT_1175667 [Paraphaeosphaeria sporulosa]|uniref:Uncharacterized protein n=1 Tax=Paraphaeosphaeria sporulosa TaxID=1460663 RepID=A0A177CDX0_9PLEO|nr:uncharacterized protein CC84DRAFT_1175667 [Paraphaeosphaeria sporulosa]OAG05506.1 hypothetical protein CC84DRAFT_1175667 [Paraphaeosphaeria sporulosa]